ncbi:unnamed protein product [Calicophoron daubneyi]|uniref:Cadherin domain-containing protein n=1 Tax=Calicophoron daubneyi TaxID=300641 RepID=A0AAV2TJA3_CALDB
MNDRETDFSGSREQNRAKQLTFTLQDTSYFDFDPAIPNRLVVRNRLDRDTDRKLCTEGGWPEVCSWSGVVFVSDGRLLSLRVVVRDMNDNTPSWPIKERDGTAVLHVSVTENCPLGTTVDLPLASDPDIGENSIVRYEMALSESSEPKPSAFEIISASGPGGVKHKLVVRGQLDREQTSSYQLRIAAVDGGGNRGYAQLIVHVTDENDNVPIFTHLSYRSNGSSRHDDHAAFVITVDEDLPVGTRLPKHPVATDADEGDFGQVTYGFALSTSDVVKRDFTIDSESGAIIVRSPLDYDIGGLSQYQFVMIAHDQGSPPLTATATVVINVLDKNDNAPIITVTPTVLTGIRVGLLPGDQGKQTALRPEDDRKKLRLVENSPAGQMIATITVHDPDANENGKFTCQLGKTNELRLTYLKNLGKLSVYQLTSSRPVDREIQSEVRVTLRCRDHGIRSQSTTELLTVYIIDVNDNAPKFPNKHYIFQIPEGKDIGQVIGRLMAFDPDFGRNSQLSYSIGWSANEQGPNPFSLNSKGELLARSILDRESRPEGYQFTVIAEDGGHPRLSGSTNVEVVLIDVNDCSPVFAKEIYNFTVEEEIHPNRSDNYVIGQVKATDCDIGNNAQITYFLKPFEAPFKASGILILHVKRQTSSDLLAKNTTSFEISNEGYVSTTRTIDRERQSSFLLTVVAVDSPQSNDKRLTAKATVHVSVVDVNDHDPVFLRPPFENGTNVLKLSMHEPPGHLITWLEATDDDEGQNADIRYRLLNEQQMDMFELHPQTGKLYLRKEITAADLGVVTMDVIAVDNGAKTRTASATIRIEIADIPSVQPVELTVMKGLTSSHQPSGNWLNGVTTGANRFIITCIVLITLVICAILIAVIFLVSRGGCRPFIKRADRMCISDKNPNHGTAISIVQPGSHKEQKYISAMRDGISLEQKPTSNEMLSVSSCAVGDTFNFGVSPDGSYPINTADRCCYDKFYADQKEHCALMKLRSIGKDSAAEESTGQKSDASFMQMAALSG